MFHTHIKNAMCVLVSVYVCMCVCNYRKRGHEFDRKLDETQKELEFGKRGVEIKCLKFKKRYFKFFSWSSYAFLAFICLETVFLSLEEYQLTLVGLLFCEMHFRGHFCNLSQNVSVFNIYQET